MPQKPIVYVNKIDNLSDARFCSGMGVDYLGISIDPSSSDYVSPQKFKEIESWVSGPKWVAEYGLNSGHQVCDVDHKEYHSVTTLHSTLECNKSISSTLNAIIEIKFDVWMEKSPLIELPSNVLFLVLTDLPVYDEIIRKLEANPIIIPYLIKLEKHQNIFSRNLLKETNVAGFMVQGEKEIETGLKDYDYLDNIIV